MAQTLDTEIDLINAALTATGNSPITSLEDGTAEADVAAANFTRLRDAELVHPWTWTQTTRRLNRRDGETATMWLYAYQIPDGVEVERLEVAGQPIGWESWSDLLLTNAAEGVVAVCRWVPPVRRWPPDFKAALVTRLEALFLRSPSEEYEKAAARDKAADDLFARARTRDSRKRSPRTPTTSALLAARRG